MQRALGAFEPRHQILERDSGSPRGEDSVELEDAVELVHGGQQGPTASPSGDHSLSSFAL